MNKELKDKQEQQRCFHRKEGDTRERMIMKRGIKMEHTFKVKRSGILLIKELDLLINKVQEFTLRQVKRIYCIQAEACAERNP